MTLDESSKLSPEQLRVAVAERLGWTQIRLNPWMVQGVNPGGKDFVFSEIPNYPESLDACHEFEESLHPSETEEYIEYLGEIVRDYWKAQGKRVEAFSTQSVIYAHAHALPTQRCRAFLAVTGKS